MKNLFPTTIIALDKRTATNINPGVLCAFSVVVVVGMVVVGVVVVVDHSSIKA